MASADGQTHPRVGDVLGETASIHGSAEKLDSSTVNRVLMEFLAYFGRAIFVLYPVYLTGYLGLSISWVLLIMLMATWWKKNRQTKVVRIGTAIDFVDNETQLVNKELGGALQMATWVCIVSTRVRPVPTRDAPLKPAPHSGWCTLSRCHDYVALYLHDMHDPSPGCRVLRGG